MQKFFCGGCKKKFERGSWRRKISKPLHKYILPIFIYLFIYLLFYLFKYILPILDWMNQRINFRKRFIQKLIQVLQCNIKSLVSSSVDDFCVEIFKNHD